MSLTNNINHSGITVALQTCFITHRYTQHDTTSRNRRTICQRQRRPLCRPGSIHIGGFAQSKGDRQKNENRGNRHQIIQELKTQLNTTTIDLPDFYTALLSLPTNRIFTTNYDDLLEQALRIQKCEFDVHRQNTDAGFWTADRVQLVKLHGDLEVKEQMVLTTQDYHAYFEKHSARARSFSVALQSYTVLFLGYRAKDPNLQRILTFVRNESENLARKAYAVLMDADKWNDIKPLERHQIDVIDLAEAFPVSQQNDYSTNLTLWLEQLSQEIVAINGTL